MKKIILGLALLVLFNKTSYSQTYAIKITKFGFADMTVEFTKYGFADETWKIVGSCKSAINPTSIEITKYGFANKTIQITKYGPADRNICITNPEDLPSYVLDMIK